MIIAILPLSQGLIPCGVSSKQEGANAYYMCKDPLGERPVSWLNKPFLCLACSMDAYSDTVMVHTSEISPHQTTAIYPHIYLQLKKS